MTTNPLEETQPTPKSIGVAYLLAILLGTFGAHRLYLGKVLSGVIMALLWWGGIFLTVLVLGFGLLLVAFVWWVIDLFLIPGWVVAANARATST